MSDKLEAYLEEISHFLSGRTEREEILSEIRSHILEQAAEGTAGGGGAAVDAAIAAFGPARKVAERYLDDRPIIAPAYKRYLVRYTSFLFAIHAALTVVAVAFKKDFVIFPFLFMPRLGVLEALMYLPMAFLADLGMVAVVLYFVTQSGKDIKLPWPKFGVDLDEIKPPRRTFWPLFGTGLAAAVMLAITDFALYVFARHKTVFFANFDRDALRPLFAPEPGRRISLIVIAMLALSTMTLLIKLFTGSRWVDIVSRVVSLGLIGLLLRQPFDDLFVPEIAARFSARFGAWAQYTILFILLFIALMTTIELVKGIVIVSRRKLRSATLNSVTRN